MMTEAEYYGLTNQPLNRAIIDFDGVLATNVYPKRHIGKPIIKNIIKLNELLEAGISIWVVSSRPSSDEPAVEEWLYRNQVPFDKLICGFKPLGDIYVDDKAINSEELSWLKKPIK